MDSIKQLWKEYSLKPAQFVFILSFIGLTIAVLIFNSNEVVMQETKDLSRDFLQSIPDWFFAYMAINEKLGSTIWIIFFCGISFCLFAIALLWYQIKLLTKDYYSTEDKCCTSIFIVLNLIMLLIFIHIFLAPIVLLIGAALIMGIISFAWID